LKFELLKTKKAYEFLLVGLLLWIGRIGAAPSLRYGTAPLSLSRWQVWGEASNSHCSHLFLL